MNDDIYIGLNESVKLAQTRSIIYDKLDSFFSSQNNDRIIIDQNGQQWIITGHAHDSYFGVYEKGHECGEHTDESEYDPEDDTYEQFTSLVYLSTQKHSGQTIVYGKNHSKQLCFPSRGRMLIFDHNQVHESAQLIENQPKMWISVLLKARKLI